MSPYDVMLKTLAAVQVASIRAVVPTPPDQGTLWRELMESLGQQQADMIGPPMAIYHDAAFRERDWDIEVCMPVDGEVTAGKRLNVYRLPGAETAACVVHAGPFATITEAYDAVTRWIAAHGYRSAGPWRELNLRPPEPPGSQNDPNTVTEIQFPVEKQ